PQGLPELSRLRLVDRLPYPCSRRDQWTSNVMPIGGRFFALFRGDVLGVLGVYEEGRFRDDGVWEPSRVLSLGHYPNLHVSPGFFATHTETTADFFTLPERRLAFSFAIPDSNGSPSREHAIRHVRVSHDGLAVIQTRAYRAIVVDLHARKVVKSFPIDRDTRNIYCLTRERMIYMDNRGTLRSVEPLTGKEQWKIDNVHNDHGIRVAWEELEDGRREPCLLWLQNENPFLLNVGAGKFERVTGQIRDHWGCWGGVKVRNYLAFRNNGALIDCAAKKVVDKNVIRVPGISRGALCLAWVKPKQGNAEASIDHYDFLTPKRAVRLEPVPGAKGGGDITWLSNNFSDTYVFSAAERGERIYLWRGNNLYVYGLDGKFQAMEGFLNEETRWCRVEFLSNSILVQRTSHDAYLFAGSPAGPEREPMQVSCAPTGDGRWPREGWLPLAEPARWQLAPGQPRPQGYAYRLGANADRLFMEVVVPPVARAPEAPQAFVRLQTHLGDYSPSFDLAIPVDANPGVCAPHERLRDRLESWQEVDAQGRRHYFLSIDKAAYTEGKDGELTPRTHVEFVLRRHGEVAARALVGGMATPGAAIFRFAPMDVVSCQNDPNFQLRQNLYANASVPVPQGEDLLNWLAARRARHGASDNLQFLEGMLQRNAAIPAAANVLSAMVIERLAAFVAADPARSLIDPAVHDELAKVVRELKQKADALKVPPAYSERGLTVVAGYAMRNWGNVNDRTLVFVSMRGQKPNQETASFGIGPRNPFTWAGPEADFIVLPFGVFGGDRITPSGTVRVMFRTRHNWQRAQVGDWRLTTPAGSRVILGRDGKPGEGGNVNKCEETTMVSAAKQLWQARFQPDGEASVPEVKFPDPPKERQAIAPAALWLALESLPSDSRNGPSLADAYARAVSDPKNPVANAHKPEEVYRLLLSKVINDWGQAEFACWKLREIYGQQANNNLQAALQKLSDVMRECGATRNFQRGFFIRANNQLWAENTWNVLGPFGVPAPKAADKEKNDGGEGGAASAAPPVLAPLPETLAEPLAAEYAYNGKKGKFQLVKDKVGNRYNRFDNCPRNFFYAHATATLYDSRKPVKAYLHFRNEPWQRERTIAIKAWLRAEDPANPGKFLEWEEAGSVSIPGSDWTVRTLPVKIAPGKNQLLLRVEYLEQANWCFNVGNVNAVPIRNLLVTK
ncbi:MAG: hypothetical protein J6333_01135, partial [Planctomycetes bacterium]|nr:hypothetical protein [Planctomycetota bacterium]